MDVPAVATSGLVLPLPKRQNTLTMNTIITEKIASLLSTIESERAKYAADYATALGCGDNNGLVNGDMEDSLDKIGKSLTEIRDLIRPAASLADAARGTLSMSDMKHPDGYYTLGETGHFQQLKSALDEFDGQNRELSQP